MTITPRALAGLHRLAPIKQSVTYYVRQPKDQYAAGVAVANAEWRPTEMAELNATEIGIDKETRTWHLWTQCLSGISPKLGDYLTESDGTVWRVAGLCGRELGGARWRLLTVKGIAPA